MMREIPILGKSTSTCPGRWMPLTKLAFFLVFAQIYGSFTDRICDCFALVESYLSPPQLLSVNNTRSTACSNSCVRNTAARENLASAKDNMGKS